MKPPNWETFDTLGTRYLVGFHLAICFAHLGCLIHLLFRNHTTRHDNMWFQEVSYLIIVVLFHMGFDLYRLSDSRTFVADFSHIDDTVFPPTVIFLYLCSYAIRLTSDFPSYPTLGDIFFKNLEAKFDWQSRAYAICFSLRILPRLFLMLLNVSSYVLWDYECSGYFVCIYSWEHWLQLPILLGWAWHWRNIWSACIGFSCIFIAAIPFLFLDQIVPIALLACLLYGAMQTTAGIFFLYRSRGDVESGA